MTSCRPVSPKTTAPNIGHALFAGCFAETSRKSFILRAPTPLGNSNYVPRLGRISRPTFLGVHWEKNAPSAHAPPNNLAFLGPWIHSKAMVPSHAGMVVCRAPHKWSSFWLHISTRRNSGAHKKKKAHTRTHAHILDFCPKQCETHPFGPRGTPEEDTPQAFAAKRRSSRGRSRATFVRDLTRKLANGRIVRTRSLCVGNCVSKLFLPFGSRCIQSPAPLYFPLLSS